MHPAPPSKFWLPSQWATVGAVLGRGLALFGLSEDRRQAIAVAGPGILLESPPDWDPPSCAEGWRIADYFNPSGPVFIDRHPPHHMQIVSLVRVAELVARQAPEHGPWLADHLERQVRVAALAGLQAADTDHRRRADAKALAMQFMLEDLAEAQDRLGDLLEAADARLGRDVLRRLGEDLCEYNSAEVTSGGGDDRPPGC